MKRKILKSQESLNSMWSFFRKWSKGNRWYALPERPEYTNSPINGSGQNIFVHNGRRYLIAYTEHSEPILLGRVDGRIQGPRGISNNYRVKVLFYQFMPPQERQEINQILSIRWSNSNLKDILTES